MLNIHQIHLKWVVATIPRFSHWGTLWLRHPAEAPLQAAWRIAMPRCCPRSLMPPQGGWNSRAWFFLGKMYWKPWKIHEGFTNQMYWEKNMLPNTIRIYWEQVAIQICQNYSSFSNVLYVCSEQWLKKLSQHFFSPTPFNLLLTSKPNLGPITDIHCKHDPHI